MCKFIEVLFLRKKLILFCFVRIKDNDVMNDHLWKDVERLTELVVNSNSKLTAKERGIKDNLVSEDELKRQQTAFLEEAKRVILNQRKARRTASNRRLSQVSTPITGGGSFSTTSTFVSASSTPSWLGGGGTTPIEVRSRSNTESIAIPQPNIRTASVARSTITSTNQANALELISTSPKQFDDPNSFRHFQSIRRTLQATEARSHSPSSSSPLWRANFLSHNDGHSIGGESSSGMSTRKLSTSSHPCPSIEVGATTNQTLAGREHISSSLDFDLNNASSSSGNTPTRPRRTRFGSQSSITNNDHTLSFLNAERLNAKYDSDCSSMDFGEAPLVLDEACGDANNTTTNQQDNLRQ